MSTNIPVFTARDKDGNIIEIPALKGDSYVLTNADKQEIAELVKGRLRTETWTFTLENGASVTKVVYVG